MILLFIPDFCGFMRFYGMELGKKKRQKYFTGRRFRLINFTQKSTKKCNFTLDFCGLLHFSKIKVKQILKNFHPKLPDFLLLPKSRLTFKKFLYLCK